jgi:hypothetical protein
MLIDRFDIDYDWAQSFSFLLKGEYKMSRVQELISVLSEKEVLARESIAKAQRLCKICGNPAIIFRTHRAKMEYDISMMCQSCQDYYFPTEH